MKHIKKFNESSDEGLEFTIDEFEDVMQLEWEKYKGLEKLYKIVDCTNEGGDLGKGIEERKVIIQRLSDNRFFEFEYSHDEGRNNLGTPGLGNPSIMTGIEVYPHKVTKIIYKYKPQI